MIKIGDLVKAKMGGPVMTVEIVSDDGIINTCWFNKNDDLMRDAFDKIALKAACEED